MVAIKFNVKESEEIKKFMEEIKFDSLEGPKLVDLYLKALHKSFAQLEEIRYKKETYFTHMNLHARAFLFKKLIEELSWKINYTIYSKIKDPLISSIEEITEFFDPIFEILIMDDLNKRNKKLLLRAFWNDFCKAFNKLNFSFSIKTGENSYFSTSSNFIGPFYEAFKQEVKELQNNEKLRFFPRCSICKIPNSVEILYRSIDLNEKDIYCQQCLNNYMLDVGEEKEERFEIIES